ncbi:MAG TPA: hypothetical protein VGC19_08005 [Rhodanobacter sp.]
MTVLFDTPEANREIRYRKVVFLPVVANNTKISWNSSTHTTLPNRDLPVSCRK